MTPEELAWNLYCHETAGDGCVADFWEELPKKVQDQYLLRADTTVLVDITRTFKQKVEVKVELPFYYKHDLLPDDRDYVVYGKVCKNGGHSKITIASNRNGTSFEIEFEPVNWDALSSYLTNTEFKSTEAEYLAAKARLENAVKAL